MLNLRLSKTVPILTAIFAILLAGQVVILAMQSRQVSKDISLTETELIPLVTALKDTEINIIQVQQWLTDISATRGLDGLNDGYDEAAAAAEGFAKNVALLKQLDPANIDQYNRLEALFVPYYQLGKKMAAGYVKGGPELGNKLMTDFDTGAENLAAQLEEVLKGSQKHISEGMVQQKTDNHRVQLVIYAFAVIFAILLTVLVIGTQILIVKPARYISDRLSRVAGGDFSVKLEMPGNSEFVDIATASNQIVDHLGQDLREITVAGMQVSAYAHALTYAIADAQGHMDEQERENETMVTSIDRLASLGKTVEEKAEQATSVSSRVKNDAHTGDQLLERTVKATHNLAENMSSARTTVSELANSSKSITAVMTVIQSIAEQTNLLALNAAIEAARAGDQGRGFAVVADEVRSLASKTQESAGQINTMIQELQSRANQTVNLITENEHQALENASNSEQVIAALRNIFEAIVDLDQLNSSISLAARDQTQQADQVHENVLRSKAISEVFMAKSDQSGRFSQRLSANAKRFSNLASKLNVFND